MLSGQRDYVGPPCSRSHGSQAGSFSSSNLGALCLHRKEVPRMLWQALQATPGWEGSQSLVLFLLAPSCSDTLGGVVAWDGSLSSSHNTSKGLGSSFIVSTVIGLQPACSLNLVSASQYAAPIPSCFFLLAAGLVR